MAFRGGGSGPKDEDYFLQFGGYHHKNRRRHHLSAAAVKILFSLVLIGVMCFVVYQSDHYSIQLVHKSPSLSRPRQNFGFSFHGFKYEDFISEKKEENSLDNTLRRAAMEDEKTVILTTLNAAWAEPGSVFDLFLESLRIGIETQSLVQHLVVAALDGKAYSRCSEVHPHCFALTTARVDFSGPEHVSSYDYNNKMLWRRVEFLRSVLEMGYDFIYTDADIMWLRNPFERLNSDADLQIAIDLLKHNSTSLNTQPNAGYLYAKSSNRTIHFYDLWYTKKDDFPQSPDQALLSIVKSDPFPDQIGLKIRFLDSAYFRGLCFPAGDLDSAVTMRADCCAGLEDKIHDMKLVLEDWRRYVAEGDWTKGGTWRSKDSWRCGLKK